MKILAIVAMVALLVTVVKSQRPGKVTCYRYSATCNIGGISASSPASCCNRRGLSYRIGNGPCALCRREFEDEAIHAQQIPGWPTTCFDKAGCSGYVMNLQSGEMCCQSGGLSYAYRGLPHCMDCDLYGKPWPWQSE